MKDLLNAESAQRVDLRDFLFGIDASQQGSHQELMGEFVLNPNSPTRYRVLEGFAISNPSGKQLQVARGRAIMGQREGAIVKSAALTTAGDANKIVDMTAFSLGTYGIYIRFELVDGDNETRSFWDPSGGGAEFSQIIATKRLANWSMRVESSSPGTEWMYIGDVDQATMGITDKRDFMFEGSVDSTYAPGWSAEGGGIANDRNADRQQYGVKDFHTFTAALRQCLEDIKGRGLKRWWEKSIGGMNIGFDSDPLVGRLAVESSSVNPAVYGKNLSTGYAVIAEANPTSPARGALRIVSQDTEPTTKELGAVSLVGKKPAHCDGVTFERFLLQSYANVTNSSEVANTATETKFDRSYTIPADSLKVGSTIRIRAAGEVDDWNNGGLVVRARLGGVSGDILGSVSQGTPAAADSFFLDIVATIRTIGSPGSVRSTYQFVLGGDQKPETALTFTGTPDTTGSLEVCITADWASAHADNRVTLHSLVIDVN